VGKPLTVLNYGLCLFGCVGVALRTHDLIAVALAFVASLHFTYTVKGAAGSAAER